MKHLLWLLLALTACAPITLNTFATKKTYTYDPRDYPDDAAVVLHRADGTRLVVDGSEVFTLSSRHEVIAVLTEGGLELAQVTIPFGGDSELHAFSARIIRPDGTEQVLGKDALLVDDGKGKNDANARYFRFPNVSVGCVSVGCVLEYRWTLESPRLWSFDEQDTLGEYPVKHYEFELTAPRELVLETIELNGGAPITIDKGDELNTLRFSLDDLPARRAVDAQPHWTFTEPRWAWRVVASTFGRYTDDWLRDWKDVVTGYGDLYFNRRSDGDFDEVPFDASGCSDVSCTVQRALDLVREHTEQRDVRWNRAARLNDAWHSGRASNVEQVLMLKSLLERQGIQSWLGFGTGLLNQQTMQFPNTSQFDRLFLVLRPQKGVSKTMFIDPSCEACRAGEMAPEYAAMPVCVFRTIRRVDVPVTDALWEQPHVNTPPSTVSFSHVATLTTDGAIEDELQVTALGMLATPVLEKWKHEKSRLFSTERRIARAGSPLARVQKTKWNDCEATRCGWTTQVRYEKETSRDGGRWLVPTSFLRAAWEDMFLSETRDVDVHFTHAQHFEEVADVVAPPGLQLVAMPPPVKAGRDGFSVEVTWERTPTGARVTRRMTQEIVAIPAGRYGEVRATLEAFTRARREVLVFAPKP